MVAPLEQRRRMASERAQPRQLALVEVPRTPIIGHAHRPEGVPLVGDDRGAGVEAQTRRTGHLRILRPTGSLSVSGTTRTPVSCVMVRAQKDAWRGASELSTPINALPHWRSASTKLMIAIGVSQSAAASATTSSKSGSGAESRISSS
jgi:hypothetical protein